MIVRTVIFHPVTLVDIYLHFWRNYALATCPMMNTSPGTLDMQYRTYTVVVFVDNSNYDPFLVYRHAKAFLDLGDFGANDLKNIWLYQFIALCSDGTGILKQIYEVFIK